MTDSSLTYLGLRTDASEIAIKRAYAQRLKQMRPEDDPEGFQTLHEHYRIALDQAQQRSIGARTDTLVAQTEPMFEAGAQDKTAIELAHDTAPPPPNTTTEIKPPTTLPAFDSAVFLQTLLTHIDNDDADRLLDWLQSIDAFWSLAVKNHAGHAALHRLANDCPAVRPELFNVMLTFFDFDNALSGYDHFAIARLRSTLQMQYELQDTHRDYLAERMQREGNFLSSQTRTMVNVLRRPFELWRDYASAMVPGRPTSMLRFIHILSHGQPDLLCPPIDPQHLRFWYAVADRVRFTRPRVLLGYLRVIALVVSAATILSGLTLALPPSPPKRFEQAHEVLVFFAWALVGLIGLWTAWLILLATLRWQTGPENGRLDRNNMGRLLFVPAVAGAAATACTYTTHVWLLNTGLTAAVVVAVVAVLRFWRRAGLRFPAIQFGRFSWIAGVVGLNLVRMLFDQGSHSSPSGYTGNALSDSDEWQARAFIGVTLASVAGLAWVMDLIRQRQRFSWRSAESKP